MKENIFRKMKGKILLLLVLVLGISSIYSLDREVYMPKKLVNAELPDDYPRELEELFKIEYQTIKKYTKLVEKYGINLPTKEKFSLAKNCPISPTRRVYLNWLALTAIPAYYSEYYALNSFYISLFLNESKNNILNEKIRQKSILIKELKRDDDLGYNTFIRRGNSQIVNKRKNFLLNHDVWVKAKVISSRMVNTKHFIENYEIKTNLVKIKIIEDISGMFPYDELEIECFYTGTGGEGWVNSEIKTLKENEMYLIPIRWRKRFLTYKQNGKTIMPIVSPTAALTSCMLLKNGFFNTFDLESFRKSGWCMDENAEHYTRKIFGEKCSYTRAKRLIIDEIQFLKNKGEK